MMDGALDLVLIDLQAQQAAVVRFVHGWTKSAILEWMQTYGEVSDNPRLGVYVFRSCVDHRMYSFGFMEDKLFIIR